MPLVLQTGMKRYIEQPLKQDGLTKFFTISVHLCVILKDLGGDGAIPFIIHILCRLKENMIMKFKFLDQQKL